jgi:hypothetical protein
MPLVGLLLVALFFAAASVVRASDLNDQLNAAYKKILARSDVTPSEMNWLEQHWITYRDAEANFEATCANPTNSPETTRTAALENLTRIRLGQLEHLAADGKFADLKPGTYKGSDALPGGLDPNFNSVEANTYDVLRAALIARRQPVLIAALIASEKAWLNFAGLQEDNEGINRPNNPNDPNGAAVRNVAAQLLDEARLNELQHDASLVPISLPTGQLSPNGIDINTDDRSTYLSPDGTLRIEQPGRGICAVNSNLTGKRTELANVDHDAENNTGKVDMESEFEISPDNVWILRTQKIYHGLDGAYLYKRASTDKFEYQPATREALDVLAWKFFQQITKRKEVRPTEGGVVNFAGWKTGALRLSLNASSHETDTDIADFIVAYNLKTGTFSIPKDVAAHNQKAVATGN